MPFSGVSTCKIQGGGNIITREFGSWKRFMHRKSTVRYEEASLISANRQLLKHGLAWNGVGFIQNPDPVFHPVTYTPGSENGVPTFNHYRSHIKHSWTHTISTPYKSSQYPAYNTHHIAYSELKINLINIHIYNIAKVKNNCRLNQTTAST